MKAASLSLLLLFAWHGSVSGQEEPPSNELAKEWMRKGQEAMNSKLWEVAAHHYEALLAAPDLSDELRTQASIRLAEAMIRDGRPDRSMELLEQSHLQTHPDPANR